MIIGPWVQFCCGPQMSAYWGIHNSDITGMSAITTGEAEELRDDVKAILRKKQPPRSNITKEKQKALKELKNDNNKMVLTADKVHDDLSMVMKWWVVKKWSELIMSAYIELKWLEDTWTFPPQLQPAADWLPCQAEAVCAKTMTLGDLCILMSNH